MKPLQPLLFLIFLFISNYSIAQNNTEAKNEQQQSVLFTEAESDYIDQWFSEFVKEMELSEEIAYKYQDITNGYSSKMDEIGKDNPNIAKSEVSEQFNNLIESQHLEIKSILTDTQYQMYYDNMQKVVWSINQRLRQL